MIKKIVRIIITIAGMSIGYGFSALLFFLLHASQYDVFVSINPIIVIVASVISVLIFGLIFYIITPRLEKLAIKISKIIDSDLQKIPSNEIATGTIGLIIGLIIANLISNIFEKIEIFSIGTILTILTYILLGYLGISISTKKYKDIILTIPNLKKSPTIPLPKSKGKNQAAKPKILDTSVIIDGRIADILKTGFVEGTVILPEFMLEELRHIADSSDSLKRNRGRRGLDILNKIQNENIMNVQITDRDFDDVLEVDMKLLKLAEEINGKVVTNDYNLNKVAELRGVEVLNINELANALKPIVMPGEEMIVTVIKEGKENKQGIAYLDDGTMIVVEEGRKHIGETLQVVVTSVLQTAAGRMIFAKSKAVLKNRTA